MAVRAACGGHAKGEATSHCLGCLLLVCRPLVIIRLWRWINLYFLWGDNDFVPSPQPEIARGARTPSGKDPQLLANGELLLHSVAATAVKSPICIFDNSQRLQLGLMVDAQDVVGAAGRGSAVLPVNPPHHAGGACKLSSYSNH